MRRFYLNSKLLHLKATLQPSLESRSSTLQHTVPAWVACHQTPPGRFSVDLLYIICKAQISFKPMAFSITCMFYNMYICKNLLFSMQLPKELNGEKQWWEDRENQTLKSEEYLRGNCFGKLFSVS